MVFYPQSILDEIRDRLSIVSYIGEYVPLKKAGRNHKGLCPFHAEKTSSFMVSDDKQIFHCFGCGEGGNIFNFVMKYDGLNFREAVELLASKSGTTLPKIELSQQREQEINDVATMKKLLFRVNEIAMEYFHSSLENMPEDSKACKYLKLRGIKNDIFKQHFLGYADDKWESLTGYLKTKKVPLDLAEKVGLIKRRDTGDYYDFFRGRIIFPIISTRNEVIGFGGRVIEKDENSAKYLNSSDSIIYNKSKTVYALNVAQRIARQEDQLIVVEGYMDVIALNSLGFNNAVAPLGTALTEEHIRLLMRYSKNIVLIFDGDLAGISAAERSLNNFIQIGIMPKIVILPDGQDPDDWSKAHTKKDLDELIASADTLLAWLIKMRSEKCLKDPLKKAEVVTELRPFFMHIENAVEFSFYRKLTADFLKIDENDLLNHFKYTASANSKIDFSSGASEVLVERALLSLLIEYPDFIYKVKTTIDATYFTQDIYRKIFTLITDEKHDGKFSAGRIFDQIQDDGLRQELQALISDNEYNEKTAILVMEDCLNKFKNIRLENRLKVISSEIRKAENMQDEEKILSLVKEKNELLAGNVVTNE